MHDAIPELDLLTQAGWQPVTAMKTDKRLWLSRYGDGLHSYLVLGNPKGRDISTIVDIDTSYLGGGGLVFADIRGEKLSGAMKANQCKVKMKIASTFERILSPCARIETHGFNGAMKFTTKTTDTLKERTVSIRLQSSESQPVSMTVGEPDSYYFSEALINGERLPVSRTLRASFDCPPDAEIELKYNSLYFASTETELLNFPFATKDQPSAEIVIPDNATTEETYLASRLQEYFRYYFSNRYKNQHDDFVIPIVYESDASPGKPHVVIGKAAREYRQFWPWNTPARVRVGVDQQKNQLYVVSPEQCDADLREGFYRLLACLDKEYVYFGRIGDRKFEHPDEESLFAKAGLLGKTLRIEKEIK